MRALRQVKGERGRSTGKKEKKVSKLEERCARLAYMTTSEVAATSDMQEVRVRRIRNQTDLKHSVYNEEPLLKEGKNASL